MRDKYVFVFTEKMDTQNGYKTVSSKRPKTFAIPEDKIKLIETQHGSNNCYLKVNGIEVEGSFDSFVLLLGRRIDIK